MDSYSNFLIVSYNFIFSKNKKINKIPCKSEVQKDLIVLFKKLAVAVLACALVGVGIAFTKVSNLGVDPISVFIDGIRNIFDLPANKLGTATDYVILATLIINLIFARRYINFGTVAYTFLLGKFVSMGFLINEKLQIPPGNLTVEIILAGIGFVLPCTGIALLIAINIGQDPMTGFQLMVTDFTKKSYKIVKVVLDVCFVIVGALMGGAFGAATVCAAFLSGPLIQALTVIFQKFFNKNI